MEISEQEIARIYPELQRMARRLMARERKGHTWQPTALTHEAILRVIGLEQQKIKDTQHFFLLAVGQMRRLLVSHARKKMALKRQGGEWLAAGSQVISVQEALEVDEVLDRLKEIDERAYNVVLLRLHGGLTEEETAAVLKLGPRTVRRDWEWAKTYLYGELQQGR